MNSFTSGFFPFHKEFLGLIVSEFCCGLGLSLFKKIMTDCLVQRRKKHIGMIYKNHECEFPPNNETVSQIVTTTTSTFHYHY